MGAIANKTHILETDLADAATASGDDAPATSFVTPYPAGVTQGDLDGTTAGQLVAQQITYYQDQIPGVVYEFGDTEITVTNNTGTTIPAGSELILSFGATSVGGGYNLTLGDEKWQAAPGDAVEEEAPPPEPLP